MTQSERRAPHCTIDIVVESPLWHDVSDIESRVRRAAEAALPPDHEDCELAVVLTDDQTMRALNARFRSEDSATNVLSFPAPASSQRSHCHVNVIGGVPVHEP